MLLCKERKIQDKRSLNCRRSLGEAERTPSVRAGVSIAVVVIYEKMCYSFIIVNKIGQ